MVISLWILVVIVLAIAALVWWMTSIHYKGMIDNMITKNQQLIERMKRSEEIILHDLLQLTPDDVMVLRKNMEEQVTKDTQ